MTKPVVQLVAAARPNFMKVAPLYHALKSEGWCEILLVHTGQHYDPNMSDAFFADLELPHPDYNLDVGSGTHAEQTAGVMVAHERICLERRPDVIVVVGDVNSTLACSVVAAKLGIPIAHLEAGLRSGDRAMPEEINRILTDAISDILWTPSPDGDENLKAEGISEDRIVRVGNIMIDAFELLRDKIEKQNTAERFGLKPSEYGVVTIHRPSNVDDPDKLAMVVDQLQAVAEILPIIFAVHPRTRANLVRAGLEERLSATPGLQLCDPLSYVEFMGLVTSARLVITDSGGVQEETTYLSIPCLTLRDSTERPITVTQGTNRLTEWQNLVGSVQEVVAGKWPKGTRPEYWDGQTASRVAKSLKAFCESKEQPAFERAAS